MIEIISAGGLLMIPIFACSAIAMTIILERFWSLRRKVIMPSELVNQTWDWVMSNKLDNRHINTLESGSALGKIVASALRNRNRTREIIKESVEDTGRHVVHDLEKFLNTLGTIAAISPLLGLLGTVIGMIKVFSTMVAHGVGDAAQLAGGISEALITTAAGLTVAIPSVMFYRYFIRHIANLVVAMEEQAIALIEKIDSRNVNKKARTVRRTRATVKKAEKTTIA